MEGQTITEDGKFVDLTGKLNEIKKRAPDKWRNFGNQSYDDDIELKTGNDEMDFVLEVCKFPYLRYEIIIFIIFYFYTKVFDYKTPDELKEIKIKTNNDLENKKSERENVKWWQFRKKKDLDSQILELEKEKSRLSENL